MPKRRDNAGETDLLLAAGGRKRPRPPQKHLYLVLDDWESGYSIHKLDADDAGTIHGLLDHPGAAPAVRFAVDNGCAVVFAPMRGGNIVVVSDAAPTLLYDTEAAALRVAPSLPGRVTRGVAFAMPGGEALYVLTSLGDPFPDSFEVLSARRWSWANVATPPPPFKESVGAYAVHPDGRTIFVSTSGGTYSVDTRRGGVWRRHGDWVLPFQGQGYFDAELDAWVGLRHGAGAGMIICACQVASRSGGARSPEWDALEVTELLAPCKESGRRRRRGRRLGATLSYMGDSKFCVVETVEREVDDDDGGGDGDGEEEEEGVEVEQQHCEVHVAVFGVKYNRRGELKTTVRRATGSYVVPKHHFSFAPVAFWM